MDVEIEQVMETSPFLRHVGHHPSRSFEAGEAVIVQGHSVGDLYILVSGAVEIVRDDVRLAKTSEAGVIFGEMSALLGAAASATVKALVPAVLTVIENPRDFLITHPEESLYVAELLAHRLDSLNRYLVDVKSQYEGHDHLGMVDEVLDSLTHRPHPKRPR